MTLTKRQRELLDFISESVDRNGYAPTLEEIAHHFGLSSLATVHKHLTNLEAKGLIRRHENHSRAIEVVRTGRDDGIVELPLLGRVAAGRPIEELETPDVISVPSALAGKQPTFALRVVGDSMIEDGILDGDVIVVESRADARNGETVVAVLDGEATVKRFYRERGGAVRLQPANRAMQSIVVDGGHLELRGRVRAVLRTY